MDTPTNFTDKHRPPDRALTPRLPRGVSGARGLSVAEPPAAAPPAYRLPLTDLRYQRRQTEAPR